MTPTESTIAFLVCFALLAWGFSWIWTIKYRTKITSLHKHLLVLNTLSSFFSDCARDNLNALNALRNEIREHKNKDDRRKQAWKRERDKRGRFA